MRGLASLAAVLALAGCATPRGDVTIIEPTRPRADWTPVEIIATQQGLNAPAYEVSGPVRFAGSLVLTTAEGVRLGGLSDLKFLGDSFFVAVSDEGYLVSGGLTFADGKTPTSVVDGQRAWLLDERGRRLTDLPRRGEDDYNTWSDSEGLVLLPNGGYLVSFEHQARLWRYDEDGPHTAPSPPFPTDYNAGFEALAPSGPDSFWAAREAGGLWFCHGDRCLTKVDPPKDELTEEATLRIVSLDADPLDRGLFVLQRAYARDIGNTVTVSLWTWAEIDAGRMPSGELIRLAPPALVDNMEGLAAVRLSNGKVRLYLVSDNNFRATQKTVLMAFDLD